MANHTSLETGGPKFDVVLVSRTNNDQRPSPLEMTLRTQCRIMKVIEQKQKLNGAHFIFTKESGLAVRVYYPQDLQRMDEAILKERPSNAEEVYALLEQWNSGDENAANAKKQDIDGLRAFRKYFQFCFVICILPGEGGKAYLDRPDSILHRMQQIMCSFVDDPAPQNKTSRVVMVPNMESAIKALSTIAGALKVEKRNKKKQYIAKTQQRKCIPNTKGEIRVPNDALFMVSTVLENWARQLGLPENEENILMADLQTLGTIATATDAELDSVPIESKTKAILHSFFGSQRSMGGYAGGERASSAPNATTKLTPGVLNPLLPQVSTKNSFYESPLVSDHPIATLRSTVPPSTSHYNQHQYQEQPPPSMPYGVGPPVQATPDDFVMRPDPGLYPPTGSYKDNPYDVVAPDFRYPMPPQRPQQMFQQQLRHHSQPYPNSYQTDAQYSLQTQQHPFSYSRPMTPAGFQQQQRMFEPEATMEYEYHRQQQPYFQPQMQQMKQQQPQLYPGHYSYAHSNNNMLRSNNPPQPPIRTPATNQINTYHSSGGREIQHFR